MGWFLIASAAQSCERARANGGLCLAFDLRTLIDMGQTGKIYGFEVDGDEMRQLQSSG